MEHLDVSFYEILAEIERLDSRNPDGFSVEEMQNQFGKGRAWCRNRLKRLIQAGKADCTGKKMVPAIDGMLRAVPVYKIKSNTNG